MDAAFEGGLFVSGSENRLHKWRAVAKEEFFELIDSRRSKRTRRGGDAAEGENTLHA